MQSNGRVVIRIKQFSYIAYVAGRRPGSIDKSITITMTHVVPLALKCNRIKTIASTGIRLPTHYNTTCALSFLSRRYSAARYFGGKGLHGLRRVLAVPLIVPKCGGMD